MVSEDTQNEKSGHLHERIQETAHGKDVDQAYVFLAAHADGRPTESANMQALRRKVDWRIVPILFLCYTMNLIDKVAYNVSKRLRGLEERMLTLTSSTRPSWA